MTGLRDVDRLRQGERSGQNGQKSGHGRPKVGPKSGHGRGQKNGATGSHANNNGTDDDHDDDGEIVDIPPVRSQPVEVVDQTLGKGP